MNSDVQVVDMSDWHGHLPKLLGLAGLVCIAYAGARQLSYWILPLGGLIFAGAAIIEQRALWQYALSTSSFVKAARQLLRTLLPHIVVVAIVYLLFFGLAAIVTGRAGFTPFGARSDRACVDGYLLRLGGPAESPFRIVQHA